MEACDSTGLETEALRSAIKGLELNQSSFAGLLSELGDKREFKTILRSIQQMASADARVSGEMQVILLQRDKSRARRIAQATQWAERDNGSLTAEIQGVRLTLHLQSRGRWSLHARHVAEGPDGYSLSVPHWRSSLEAAKIRAVLGSGLIGHSQKMTVAARATAERKTVGHRS